MIIQPPARCPKRHILGPNEVLVGHQACLGHGGGHTTWTCHTCDQTVYGPPLNTHCTCLDGPAVVRISKATYIPMVAGRVRANQCASTTPQIGLPQTSAAVACQAKSADDSVLIHNHIDRLTHRPIDHIDRTASLRWQRLVQATAIIVGQARQQSPGTTSPGPRLRNCGAAQRL